MTAKTTPKPSSKKVSTVRAEEMEDPLLVPRVLPRGLNSLPRDIVLLSQRSRLVEAIAHFVAAKGYPNTSVADIIARAGVSRTTFYQQFQDKEDCYFSCFERLSESHLKRVTNAMHSDGTPKERLIASVGAYLEHLSEDGEFALAFFAEASSAGDRVRARSLEIKTEQKNNLIRWHQDLRKSHPELIAPPSAVFDLVIDGSDAFLVRWVRNGFQLSVREAKRDICYFLFASLGLQEWAKEVLAV
ncbi:TetR/AcrR family transcriptional regulator [Pseudomonas sp. Z18(2022)]|uniref:TetR/AcrR family transcriptional regulator n=1 Tax=Pseudomonas sp. Z18(2022) TaxID=2983410 RepID=UPI002E81206B|nr:TetR/AcrR family transcriptional regulator [Pseudomonas sp. Z18(2022)]